MRKGKKSGREGVKGFWEVVELLVVMVLMLRELDSLSMKPNSYRYINDRCAKRAPTPTKRTNNAKRDLQVNST